MRGFLVGTFALIALQVFTTKQGADAAGGLLGIVQHGLEANGDPHKAGLPSRGGSTSSAAPAPSPSDPSLMSYPVPNPARRVPAIVNA